MTENYIDQLLELAAGIVTLADAESTLDKREWKAAKEQHDSLEAKFKEVRNIYVDFLLGTPEGHDQAYDLVAADIAAILKVRPDWEARLDQAILAERQHQLDWDQLDRRLREERDLLVARVDQLHAPVGPRDRERQAHVTKTYYSDSRHAARL